VVLTVVPQNEISIRVVGELFGSSLPTGPGIEFLIKSFPLKMSKMKNVFWRSSLVTPNGKSMCLVRLSDDGADRTCGVSSSTKIRMSSLRYPRVPSLGWLLGPLSVAHL
jgi:hypothetical protein